MSDDGARRLVAGFAPQVAEMLLRLGVELGFRSVLVEPDPTRLMGAPRPHGDLFVHDLAAADLDDSTDVVLTDHHRPEIGDLLREALASPARWIGIMGNPTVEPPHVAALEKL